MQNLEKENTSAIQLEINKNIDSLKIGDKVFVKFEGNSLFDFS